MKEIAMPFIGEMIKQIELGNKTHTRRIINPQPVVRHGRDSYWQRGQNVSARLKGNIDWLRFQMEKVAPLQPGDFIWIKETYYAYGYWRTNGLTKKRGDVKREFVDNTLEFGHYLYNPPKEVLNNSLNVVSGWYKRNPRFMPKVAARRFLEVVDVNVSQIQDIKGEDVLREGVGKPFDKKNDHHLRSWELNQILKFRNLWTKINGADSWENNDWVYDYTFKRDPNRWAK